MPFDSQGNFTRVMNWQEDAANAVPIVASRHDDEDDNFAQGFNETLCRNGCAAMTGNLKMGSYKITGLGNGTTTNDAVNYGQLSSAQTTLQGNIDAIETLIKTKIYGVGSIYAETTNTNPNTTLGFGTWTLLTSSVITSVQANTPVYGNGKALGLTSGGTDKRGLRTWQSGTTQASFNGDTTAYNETLPSSAVATNVYTNGTVVGVVTEGESGLIADMSGATSITIYIWKRTA